MATHNTDVAAGQLAALTNSVRDLVDGTKVTGDIRMLESIYTTDATEVTGAVIRIGVLPVGAYLLPEKCWAFSEGIGGTTIIATSIGDQADDDRYATADLALTAASTILLPFVPLAAILLARHKITAASNIITATLTGTFPATAAKKIIWHLEYRMP